jgi:hypothetical protein
MRAVTGAWLVFGFLALAGSNVLAQSAGISYGRANEADVTQLISDLNVVSRAESRISRAAQESLPRERQEQLLGLAQDDGRSNVTLLENTRAWWRENLLQPASDIAANPAASCNVAQGIIWRILSIDRQRQLLGLQSSQHSATQILF